MKKTLLVLIMVMLLPLAVLAQSSGKIAGVVTDKGSGEPLPGVNVVIEGTSFGSATDEDGYYVILNVPVGTIKLTASFIGYGTVAMENVRISAGITTEANFQLETTQLELGEAIVIVAERPLVEKNVTSSVSLVTSEEIEALPVRGLAGLVATQASVVFQDDNIHIRGGRNDEVGFYLDGALTSSSLDPEINRVNIIQEAVEEFQVLAGGYTAEFGDANAGIVRSELKTGGTNYHATVDFFTDKLADKGDKFLGTYSYRQHNLVTSFSGPILGNKIRFFIAYENAYQGDNEIRFSEGFERYDLEDRNPQNPDTEGNTYDLVYPDGYTPGALFQENTFNGTLLFDYSPIRFRIGGSYQMTKNQIEQNQNMINMLNNRGLFLKSSILLLTGKLTHVVSPKTLYELRVSYFDYFQERDDDYFGNDWDKWADSASVAQHTNGRVIYPFQTYNNNTDLRLGGIDFARDGDLTNNFYTKQLERYIGLGMDFTTQYGRHHEIKAGFDVKRYTARAYSVSTRVSQYYMPEGSEYYDEGKEAIPYGTWGDWLGRTYGYDWYGDELDDQTTYEGGYYLDGAKHPVIGSMYVQDKIEYNDLIINAGLRFDYFDTQDYRIPDIDNLSWDQQTQFLNDDAFEEVDPFTYVSPRLGFSFPVSSKTVFYSQYGKFVQKPALNDAYWGPWSLSTQVVGAGNFYTVPIGFGLEPIKTTSYEIGFKQELTETASMEIAGFYRNVKGQITIERIYPDPASGLQPFNMRQNGDFATTKGYELKLQTRRINRVYASMNYTYTNAEGTGANALAHIASSERESQKPSTVNELAFNQKHRGSIVLDYRFKPNDGGPVLGGFGINMLYQFNSGHPFTRVYIEGLGQVSPYEAGVNYLQDTRTRLALEPIGASSTPWNHTIDLRIDKQFRLMDKLDLTVYMRVNNLLNAKNVNNVYPLTGNANDDGLLQNPLAQSWINEYGEDFTYLYKAINLTNGQAYWDVFNGAGLELFGTPRQIFFGIKLNY